jgi:DNA-binding NarL/FixJ family response regulator
MAESSLRPVRVLIADDEPHIRKLVSRIVASLGGSVVAQAGDGREAILEFDRHHPEMVILDINMPLMTGDQVLRAIMQKSPRTAVVMMTAQDTLEAIRACLEAGARDYILKSNPAQEIHRLLEEAWPGYVRDVQAAA